MAGIEVKNVNSPDEVRPFADKGHANVLQVGGHPVLYGTFEPGWRWSEHLKPIAGTDSCQATHLIYCLSGRMKVVMNDGSEGEIGPGDLTAASVSGLQQFIDGQADVGGIFRSRAGEISLP